MNERMDGLAFFDSDADADAGMCGECLPNPQSSSITYPARH